MPVKLSPSPSPPAVNVGRAEAGVSAFNFDWGRGRGDTAQIVLQNVVFWMLVCIKGSEAMELLSNDPYRLTPRLLGACDPENPFSGRWSNDVRTVAGPI